MSQKNIAIIGAGISGLICAYELSHHFNITLFEKSRGVSGRTSTRYADKYEFDHGAGYFTARTPKFQNFVQSLCDKNIIIPWNPKIEGLSNNQSTFKKLWFENHYVGFSRMNDIAKHLVSSLNDTHKIYLNTEIEHIETSNNLIELTDKNKTSYKDFDYLIITAPAPQAFNLLPAHIDYRLVLKDVTMSPAYCLMIGSSEKLAKQTSIYECNDDMLDKIIVNSDKPNRPNTATCLVVQSTAEWANHHIDAHIPEMQEILLKRTLEMLNLPDFKIDFITTHRWRYAKTAVGLQQPFLWDNSLRVGVCGDYFISDSTDENLQGIESSYVSANALIEHILNQQ